MNIVINADKCNPENVTIFKNTKHKTRVGYKENKLLLNGLCLNLNLQGLCILYIHQSYKCTFGFQKNKEVLEKLIQLEDAILSRYSCPIESKQPVYNMRRQLTETPGTIPLSHIKRGLYKSVVVKIIGIWESETGYGLIYFFYPTNLEPYPVVPPSVKMINDALPSGRPFRYPSTCVHS